jgi:hypothetical protein
MKLVSAAALALAFPASARAALEVKLAVVPDSPKKGASTVVQLRPYWTYNRPDGSCCMLKPAAVSYPFKVQAVSPAGRVARIVVRRTKNRYVWAGRLCSAHPAAGRCAPHSGARATAGSSAPGRGSASR